MQRWSPKEDAVILEMIHKSAQDERYHGKCKPCWTTIQAKLGGRSTSSIRNRWQRIKKGWDDVDSKRPCNQCGKKVHGRTCFGCYFPGMCTDMTWLKEGDIGDQTQTNSIDLERGETQLFSSEEVQHTEYAAPLTNVASLMQDLEVGMNQRPRVELMNADTAADMVFRFYSQNSNTAKKPREF
jgi:hypothetical protein